VSVVNITSSGQFEGRVCNECNKPSGTLVSLEEMSSPPTLQKTHRTHCFCPFAWCPIIIPSQRPCPSRWRAAGWPWVSNCVHTTSLITGSYPQLCCPSTLPSDTNSCLGLSERCHFHFEIVKIFRNPWSPWPSPVTPALMAKVQFPQDTLVITQLLMTGRTTHTEI
jgi:hypothetical protein